MSKALRKLLGRPGRAGLRLLHSRRTMLGPTLESFIVGLVNPKRKRFLPPDVTVEDFFRRLDERGVKYVVLRWFEALPKLDRKHDLDVLVADHSVAAMVSALSVWPIGHPLDLYSESGIASTTYALSRGGSGRPVQIPLFPPALARGILRRRLRHRDLCFVPNPEDHFNTLAYHAIYLKGARSGIPEHSSCDEDLAPATHDYALALRALGARIGIDLSGEITRARIANVLAERGWMPPAG